MKKAKPAATKTMSSIAIFLGIYAGGQDAPLMPCFQSYDYTLRPVTL